MPLEVQSLAEWEAAGVPGLLSVVVPAHNEEGHVAETARSIYSALSEAGIHHEILVVNDNSSDRTEEILQQLQAEIPTLRHINNAPPHGFGFAVRCGLAEFRGDVVALMMADLSDSPDDLVRFYHKLLEGYDCVFGSRFMRGGKTVDYPWFKLILNRAGNLLIQAIFFRSYNDTTNAFKMYRRSVIAGVQPLLAFHFNLTVELPLKAMVREYKYAVVPNSWHNRKQGVSKFHIKEMGSRYLFIILYCWLERRLSMKDYRRQNTQYLKQTQLQVWHR